MATFNYVVPYKKEDGTANVRIRIIHQRKKKEISTNIILEKKDVTASGNIRNAKIVDQLEDILSNYRKKANALGLRINRMNVDELWQYLNEDSADEFKLDFVKYASEKLRQRKFNTARIGNTAVASLHTYIGFDFDINQLSKQIIQDWVNDNANKHNSNTAITYYKKVRAIFNMAVAEFNDEDIDVIRIKRNPFKAIKLPTATETKKKALDVDIIRNIYNLQISESYGEEKNVRAFVVRDLFILSFLLVGMNAIDIYNCSPMKDGYIEYNRTKVKDSRVDKAYIKIKVPELAKPILERYKSNKNLLNITEQYSYTSFCRLVTVGMQNISKMIGQKVTFYSARHSWATIAYNDCGVDKYIVHEALNHVDKALAITDVYIKKDFSQIDEANEKVIDYVFVKQL